jgi:opacity protein-like surface antigen
MKKPFVLLSTLAAALLLVFSAAQASAQSIRGFIRTTPSGVVTLQFSFVQPPYRLVGTRPSVDKELHHLKEGDFLVARGDLDEMEETASIDSIESVGLQELIGPWQSGGSKIYEFEDFSRLNLYKAQRDPQGVVLSRLKQMNYTVAPESGGRYSIFMSDNDSVEIGFLDFDYDGVELTMIDPKTGRVSENIKLSPIPVVQ